MQYTIIVINHAEDSSTLVVFTGQDLVSSVASLVQESTPSVVFNDQALTPSVAPATQDSTKTISSQSYGGIFQMKFILRLNILSIFSMSPVSKQNLSY